MAMLDSDARATGVGSTGMNTHILAFVGLLGFVLRPHNPPPPPPDEPEPGDDDGHGIECSLPTGLKLIVDEDPPPEDQGK